MTQLIALPVPRQRTAAEVRLRPPCLCSSHRRRRRGQHKRQHRLLQRLPVQSLRCCAQLACRWTWIGQSCCGVHWMQTRARQLLMQQRPTCVVRSPPMRLSWRRFAAPGRVGCALVAPQTRCLSAAATSFVERACLACPAALCAAVPRQRCDCFADGPACILPAVVVGARL